MSDDKLIDEIAWKYAPSINPDRILSIEKVIANAIKEYERVFDYTLPRRLPMIIRVDGRAFHGLNLEKPFDAQFFERMATVAQALCEGIQGAVLAYFQSDEISIVARDDMQNTTQPWLGKRLSKVLGSVSVSK